MGPTDARKLSPESLADLRRRVVVAVAGGMTQIEAARVFGVSRRAVGVWVRAHRAAGEAAFRPNRRGRPPGDQFALALPAQARVLDVLSAGPPEAVGLEYPLWTRRAVGALVDREFGLRLSATTVGHYLGRWGLAFEPPLPRGPYRPGAAPGARPPAGVDRDHRARTGREPRREPGREPLWATWTRPGPEARGDLLLPGVTPEVLLATSSRGATAFLLGRAPFTAADACDFGDRLVRHVGRGVRVIVCGWPAARADVLRAWADACPPGGPLRVGACWEFP